MNRTVLITGAGGFIGSAVTRLFVRTMEDAPPKFSDGTPVGHVVALLRPGGSLDRLAELPKSAAWSVEHADMTDHQALRDLLRRIRPKAILHLAIDRAAYSDLAESHAQRISLGPLVTLFEGLAGVQGARFIYTGSAWVLRPGDRLDETTPVEPRFAYARNKASEERLLPMLKSRTGVPWINLRLFNTFGKYERASRLLPYLVSSLTHRRVAELSHGDQIRDFNDVESMAQAYAAALRVDDLACGGVYHIGSGRGTSLREFAMTIANVTGGADLISFGASQTIDAALPRLVANPARALCVLGWTPDLDLESRVRRAVEWWLERRERMVPVL